MERFLKVPDFRRYRADPYAFGVEVLGEHFTEDVKRVMESVRDYPITIAKSGNAVGKTHGAARIASWFYSCFPSSQVYAAAAPPESNLKRLLWGELNRVIEKHPELFAGHGITTLQISRSAGSFIAGVTIPSSGTDSQREAKFSGKHAPNLLFILDEGDAIPEEVYRGIEACMSGGNAKLLVMFNPRHESGPVYRMERDGRANVVELSAFNHPNVVTGENQIPGAVTRETTLRRINEWTIPLGEDEKPDGECFQVPEFLVGQVGHSLQGKPFPALKAGYRRILTPAFSYMVLGEYPAQAVNQLINREWVEAARTRWDAYVAANGKNPPAGVRAVLGLDVADMGNDKNSLCRRYGGWVDEFETWNGVDPMVTADKTIRIAKAIGSQRINVDRIGVGAGVTPYMRRNGIAANGVAVSESPNERTEIGEFGTLRDELWWRVREWLRLDPGAMLPPDDELCEELCTPTYEVKGSNLKIMAKDVMRDLLKRSPDKADSLCLTFADEGKPEGPVLW